MMQFTVVVVLMVLVDPSTSKTHAASVRLVGGPNVYSGRVEVRVVGVWGTVCSVDFDDRDATVLCRMMGYRNVARYLSKKSIPGTGKIWLSGLRCTGGESSVLDCPHKMGSITCSHSKDVSISCHNNFEGIRLRNGDSLSSGRVEVKFNGLWGTICDDAFNNNTATVICKMLGFNNNGTFVSNIHRAGSGPIWLDNLVCTGKEETMMDCKHNVVGKHNCGHGEDAYISCGEIQEIRLNGGNRYSGRVEIKVRGSWGTICDDYFGTADARVICRMLGFSGGVRATNIPGGSSLFIWLHRVDCVGTELSLDECKHSALGTHTCSHTEDVAVSCVSIIKDVRLRGGPNNKEGRVEIYANGYWGTICHHSFNNNAARVVCKMLGFSGSGTYLSKKYSGGPLHIWLDYIDCCGHETSLLQCSHSPIGQHSCSHSQDVSIKCA